ncbi:ABC transporter related protein [Gemmatirosa kalamazoonensis]|uniref:ABC transporter related protein n=1 Tax=Gemmatirosa kalamazoonensis TaxID=861299 RepID=W0RGQ4_9BACT|nr:ABC transporter related protein [Gemmatirosa kalamazoonensis]
MQLEIRHLSKTYPNGVRALDDVSLSIPPGMFGLLGPNGAGKSSLMRTIATLQQPDTGTITLGDLDVLKSADAVRRLLGYLPQEFGLYPNLSAEMVLDHFATLKGLTESKARRRVVDALLEQVNLADARKKAVGGFSGGMKQRLGIAIALAGDPRLIIVDEPTAGLDPSERYRFLNLLAEIGQERIVILSTHIVDDVRELCPRMAIINRGRVVLAGEPTQVLAGVAGRIWRREMSRDELEATRATHEVISVRLVAGRPVVHVFADACPDPRWVPVDPDLEDVYFHTLAGGTIDGASGSPSADAPALQSV